MPYLLHPWRLPWPKTGWVTLYIAWQKYTSLIIWSVTGMMCILKYIVFLYHCYRCQCTIVFMIIMFYELHLFGPKWSIKTYYYYYLTTMVISRDQSISSLGLYFYNLHCSNDKRCFRLACNGMFNFVTIFFFSGHQPISSLGLTHWGRVTHICVSNG